MAHKQTVTVETEIDDQKVTLELEVFICSPERDVGIMSYYVDDWFIKSVTGTDKTRAEAHIWFCESAARQDHLEDKILEAAGY